MRLVQCGRAVREAAYRAADPLDYAARVVFGKGHLPPLSLRRHTGPLRNFESSAREMGRLLERLGLLTPSSRVLDFGCGCGTMAPFFAESLGEDGSYVGLDVHARSIAWCQRCFKADPRLSFLVLSTDGARAYCSRLPTADASVDLLLAKSVFTHLIEPEVRQYLAETARTLRSSGSALITAFLFDSDSNAASGFFPFADPTGRIRWRRRFHPAAAIAYDRALFEEMAREAGLGVRAFVAGYWPGGHQCPSGQDILVLSRA
jgi:cyclopropane fatty-acyl-phospholipid synthase-like methyltransferase